MGEHYETWLNETIDRLTIENRDLRLALEKAQSDRNTDCGMSWSGFNIYGDKNSIKHVRHLVDKAGAYDQMLNANAEINLAYKDSQRKFRAPLDQMLQIAQTKNNRNPVDQGIRQTLLNLVEKHVS